MFLIRENFVGRGHEEGREKTCERCFGWGMREDPTGGRKTS